MMLNWYDTLNETERHKEFIVEAQKERLARQVSRRNSSFARAYEHWLASLGARMVAWGGRLQARYDSAYSALPQEGRVDPCAG